MDNHLSRRTFLGAGGALAAMLLGACGESTARRAQHVLPAGSDLGAVEHIVMVMQENRSFDHYFGSYPGVRGFDDTENRQAFSQRWPKGRSPDGRLLPFHLDTASTGAECTYDLSHTWPAQHSSWDRGTMSAFVATHTSPEYEGEENGVLTMGYYTRADLPFHYALADGFTLCDRYHCSVLGPTHPNRLYWMTGTLGADGNGGGPVLSTYFTPDHLWSLSWPTMPEVLEDAGTSWKIYNPPGSLYRPTSDLALTFSDNVMLLFEAFRRPGTALHRKAFDPLFPADFRSDVVQERLPAVSWIVPPIGWDEHPPAPPALGAWYLHQVIDALVANPAVWAKTVLLVSWDENDGFFDHVPPPVPPPGTPGEWVTARPLSPEAGGVAGPIGLGMRVPMLLVSPFARGGHVYSEVADHTSQLRLIEARFGVRAPNISDWRRTVTSDLSAALDLHHRELSVPTLPVTSAKPAVVTRDCSLAQLNEVNVPVPAYPVRFPQSMPRQERASPV